MDAIALSFIYEKFLIVITKARLDFKLSKNNKVPHRVAQTSILKKYAIPDEYWSDITKQNQKDVVARRWAKKEFQRRFNEKYIKKMGFSDSYLIQVLKLARKDAERHLTQHKNCSHKLIYLSWGNPNLMTRTAIVRSVARKEFLDEIKFDTYFNDDGPPGMILYFC